MTKWLEALRRWFAREEPLPKEFASDPQILVWQMPSPWHSQMWIDRQRILSRHAFERRHFLH